MSDACPLAPPDGSNQIKFTREVNQMITDAFPTWTLIFYSPREKGTLTVDHDACVRQTVSLILFACASYLGMSVDFLLNSVR